MQAAFDNLITQLQNPQSAETQNAMRMLNTPNQTDIPALIYLRMNYQQPFFNSMGLFAAATFQDTERAFAATVLGLNPELWVNFVTAVRTFVQQPQQMQPQMQQPQQPQQPQNRYNIFSNRQQQPQQQQQRPDAEPVLGPVPAMPAGINSGRAARMEQSIYDGLYNMPVGVSESIGRNGGKKSRLRSKKRGRKSVHRRRKSSHKKRK